MSAWTIENLETQLICAYNKYDFLLAQAYVIILLLLALFINAQNRNIKRNYKVISRKNLCQMFLPRPTQTFCQTFGLFYPQNGE